jgi:DNA-3-methyladenine glycosylase II
MEKVTTTIRPRAPFDFGPPGIIPISAGGPDSLADAVYHRLLDLEGKLVLASVHSVGSLEAPELAVELQAESLSPEDVVRATERVTWILGAEQDLGPFYTLAKSDPVLSAIVQRFYGLHLPHTVSVFEALVLAILGQQLATNVAHIIRSLLIETYGARMTLDGQTYYAFPRPESLYAASVEELRRLKLSQRKAEYVRGIAAAALDGSNELESLHQLSDAEAVRWLMALRGVGQWTAQWVLVRALGRPDAFPSGDLALRRVISQRYFGGAHLSEAQVEEFSQRWSPWRTYATVYLFAALRAGV